MKLKKLLAVLLCIIMMSVAFAACSSEPQDEGADNGGELQDEQQDENANVVYVASMSYFANFPEDKHVITASDLFAKIDEGEDMFVIDTRSADDYAKGHIAGAYNMPFGNQSIAQNIELIPDDVPVYVYCYTGQTASQTTAVLGVSGKHSFNVQSGYTNGISKEAGYESYISTEAVELPSEIYPVDAEIKEAVQEYYADVASFISTATENQNISTDAVKEIVDAESDDYYILSVRRAEDYDAGHIKGAQNVPFGAGMQEGLSEIPKDKTVIVYCYSGQTASQVVGIMRLMGYEAFNMAGGMGSAETGAGWLGAGHETVTE